LIQQKSILNLIEGNFKQRSLSRKVARCVAHIDFQAFGSNKNGTDIAAKPVLCIVETSASIPEAHFQMCRATGVTGLHDL
jgi:hypothetical protein